METVVAQNYYSVHFAAPHCAGKLGEGSLWVATLESVCLSQREMSSFSCVPELKL